MIWLKDGENEAVAPTSRRHKHSRQDAGATNVKLTTDNERIATKEHEKTRKTFNC